MQRAVVLSDGPAIEPAHLPASLRSVTPVEPQPPAAPSTAPEREPVPPAASYEDAIRQFKRDLILRTLREYGWRKAESARALGVARGYLHRLIHQLEIQEEDEEIAEKDTDSSPIGPVM